MNDDRNKYDELADQGEGEADTLVHSGARSGSVQGAAGAVTVVAKFEQISELCDIGDFGRAGPLLYDVLSDGDEPQVAMAMGILAKLDA